MQRIKATNPYGACLGLLLFVNVQHLRNQPQSIYGNQLSLADPLTNDEPRSTSWWEQIRKEKRFHSRSPRDRYDDYESGSQKKPLTQVEAKIRGFHKLRRGNATLASTSIHNGSATPWYCFQDNTRDRAPGKGKTPRCPHNRVRRPVPCLGIGVCGRLSSDGSRDSVPKATPAFKPWLLVCLTFGIW